MSTAKNYYNREAKNYSNKWFDLEKNRYKSLSLLKRNQVLSEFYEFIEKRTGDIVMEVGCGTGLVLNLIAGDFNRIVGVDISYHMLSEGKKNVLKKGTNEIFLVNGDGIDIPFKNNSFDNIFCIEVIRYVKKRTNFLKSVCRTLRPGGKFIFTAANLSSFTFFPLKRLTLQKLHFLQNKEMVHYFTTSKMIRHQLEQNGFNNVTIKHVGFYNNFLLYLFTGKDKEYSLRRYEIFERRIRNVPFLKYLCETLIISCEKAV